MSRPIFALAPQLAPASSSLLTQLLGLLTLLTLAPMLLPPYPEATALAAQERLNSSDPLDLAELASNLWLSAINASMSPMESEDPTSAIASASISWITEAQSRIPHWTFPPLLAAVLTLPTEQLAIAV